MSTHYDELERLKALGDGNCAYNAAMVSIALAFLRGELREEDLNSSAFSQLLEQLYTNNSEIQRPEEGSSNKTRFQAYLDHFLPNWGQLQRHSAPTLRTLATQLHREKLRDEYPLSPILFSDLTSYLKIKLLSQKATSHLEISDTFQGMRFVSAFFKALHKELRKDLPQDLAESDIDAAIDKNNLETTITKWWDTEGIDAYFAHTSQEGSFAGAEIGFLLKHLGFNYVLYRAESKTQLDNCDEFPNAPTLYLEHTGGNHWNALAEYPSLETPQREAFPETLLFPPAVEEPTSKPMKKAILPAAYVPNDDEKAINLEIDDMLDEIDKVAGKGENIWAEHMRAQLINDGIAAYEKLHTASNNQERFALLQQLKTQKEDAYTRIRAGAQSCTIEASAAHPISPFLSLVH